jgi:LAS superfamily LD-carboxypeptidase LdcB
LAVAGHRGPRWTVCALLIVLVYSGGLTDGGAPGEAGSKAARDAAGAPTAAPIAMMRSTAAVGVAAAAPASGTTNMDPAAAQAFERAFVAARRAGLSPHISSGWRSNRSQQILFDRAVAKYGSAAKAMRWVVPPNKSAHVKGYAADVGPRSAAAWLERHGAQYGLCRRYDNEWWHFEYLATADCPARLPSPAG